MYKVARITFKPLTENDEEIPEKICDILSMLYKNGQILYDWIVEKHIDKYIATVTTTDCDSLNIKYYNKYILKKICDFDIETEIICDDAMLEDSCHCDKHSYYIFDFDTYSGTSPLICGNCEREISLVHIPYLKGEEEHYTILSFKRMGNSVVNLWMNSLSDRFTKRQITDHSSQLNKRGMEICRDLENQLGAPVYYLLHNPIGGWYQYEKNNKDLEVCPKCGGEFENLKDGYADKVCHACRLAFITHNDVEK